VKRGSLIVLEGLDGSGKSTQLAWLADALRARGHGVRETREPTDGAWGRRIREMAAHGPRVSPEEELRWFMEDRREHVHDVIRPALDAGAIVVSDRYYLSTVCYQGARFTPDARGLGARVGPGAPVGPAPEAILAASEAEFPRPDLALVLEIGAAAGLARVRARGGRTEPAFEEIVFLERVAQLFASLRCAYVERIDAGGAPEDVRAAIAAAVRTRLGLL
jgi:dTMP kinase